MAFYPESHGLRRARRIDRSVACVCEPIERRMLMCGLSHEFQIDAPKWDPQVEAQSQADLASEGGPEAVSIVWSNRGNVSDGFAAAFGTSAGAARAVVDAALNDWERVITSWNRADGTTSLQVNISISGTGFGGAGSPSSTAPADGKPRTGSFTLAAGDTTNFPGANDSNGWYFDPNPNDGAEFTTVLNAFAGRGSGLGSDFYSVVVAEMTHVLGLISDKNNNGAGWDGYLLESSGYVTNTGVTDNAEGGGSFGRFWVFDGPSVDHLMTSYNSGDQTSASWGNIVHSAGVRSTTLAFNGKNYQGSEDAGNASYSGNERTMPSWVMANVLKDAYGYSIVSPDQFGTFYSNLNRSTGVLTLRGGDFHTGSPVSADSFYIGASGSTINVSVDVPVDIPGTYAQPGGGNFPAWSSTFTTSEVSQIVIEGDDGDDDIFVYGVPSGVTVTVNAGNGNDFIQIGDGDIDDTSSGINGSVTVNGGAGTDGISYFDFSDNVGDDTYTVTSSTITKTLAATVTYNNTDVESVSVSGNPFNNTFQVNSADATVSYSFNGFNGNDTLVAGTGDFDSFVLGAITFAGGGGTDTSLVNDTTDTGNDTYQVAGNTFTKTTGGTGSLTSSSSTENLTVNGSNNNNTWSVPQVSSFLDVVLNAGSGNDSLTGFFNNDFDANLTSSLTFDGNLGTDSITVNDTAGTTADVYNLDNNSLDKGGTGVLNYLDCEGLTLNANGGDNQFVVNSSHSACPPTINAGLGDDSLTVNDGTSFLFNYGSDITFNGGTGADYVNISDTAYAGGGIYTVTNGNVALPFNGANVAFTSTDQTTIVASDGANTINVNQTNVNTLVSGGDGDDVINVGNGDFDTNMTANVYAIGGVGADVVNYNDTADTLNDIYTITSTGVAKNSTSAILYTSFFGPAIEDVVINAGPASHTFNLEGIGTSTTSQNLTINAGDGNDSLNVATGDVNGDLFGDLVMNGEAGTDSLAIDDTADTVGESWTITSTAVTATDWAHTLTYSNSFESFTLDGSGMANTMTVNSTFGLTNYLLRGNAGVDTLTVQGNNAVITLDGGAGLDSVNINTDAVGTASARFAVNQDLSALNIGLGGLLSLNAGKRLIDLQSSSINGRLDLSDGGLIDRAAAAEATYRPRLVTGYAAGAWSTVSQPAIFSTSAAGGSGLDALGYGFASEVGAATFFGSAVAAGDFLVRYTLYGDGDLSGSVNLDDFTRLAARFGLTGNWSQGNSDYDLDVDLDDFTALAATFGLSVPSDAPRASTPATAAVGAFSNQRIAPDVIADERLADALLADSLPIV